MPQFVSPPNVHPSAAVTLMKSSKKHARDGQHTTKVLQTDLQSKKKLAHQVRNELNKTRTDNSAKVASFVTAKSPFFL